MKRCQQQCLRRGGAFISALGSCIRCHGTLGAARNAAGELTQRSLNFRWPVCGPTSGTDVDRKEAPMTSDPSCNSFCFCGAGSASGGLLGMRVCMYLWVYVCLFACVCVYVSLCAMRYALCHLVQINEDIHSFILFL